MNERNKGAFWALVAAGTAIVCVPSAFLIDAARSYQSFFSGIEPSPLKPIAVHGLPHHGGGAPREDLVFVDFRARAAKAKKVFLVGDFNAWKPGTLPLARMPDGAWELTLPLKAGNYRYRFVIDGEEKLDPGAPEADDNSGKKASLREVK
jgi:1,4-alpha-glucan branching enzyme